MNLVAVQPYYKVQREVDGINQSNVEYGREIHMYEHKVCTKYREFPIEEVFDMSYRKLGEQGGFLYLHTSRGVYSYTVKVDPAPFIEAYKQLVNNIG